MRELLNTVVKSKLARFFVIGLAGVSLDLLLFSLLVAVGVRPSVSSIISSSIAVCLAYVVSSQRVFRVRLSLLRLAAYFGWYALSNTAFAIALDAAWMTFGGPPILWKIVTLPVSFLLNFAVVNYVILRAEKPES